jgi:hypothetical protein
MSTGSTDDPILADLARAYWAFYEQTTRHKTPFERADMSAWEAVDALCRIPRIAAIVVLALMESADTPNRLAYLAAGPLEDVVNRGAPEDLEILERAVQSQPRLAKALTRINVDSDSEGAAWLDRTIS